MKIKWSETIFIADLVRLSNINNKITLETNEDHQKFKRRSREGQAYQYSVTEKTSKLNQKMFTKNHLKIKIVQYDDFTCAFCRIRLMAENEAMQCPGFWWWACGIISSFVSGGLRSLGVCVELLVTVTSSAPTAAGVPLFTGDLQ